MRQLTSRQRWLAISGLLLAGIILIPLLIVMLLNEGGVNHLLTPVGSYFSMFQLIWPEHPLGALQFIITKSFIVLAHHDPRSDLNLWTLEYDAVTLFIYLCVALFAGRLLSRPLPDGPRRTGLYAALAGLAMVATTVTYMTILDHCSGPNWVGFVTLYGLGVDPLNAYPFWQWTFGGAGLALLGWGMWRLRGAPAGR